MIPSSSKSLCYRAGPVTINPFFNFLRDYRPRNCGKTIIEIAVSGAKIWNKMNQENKLPFVNQARSAPPYKSRSIRKNKRGKISRPRKSQGRKKMSFKLKRNSGKSKQVLKTPKQEKVGRLTNIEIVRSDPEKYHIKFILDLE